MSPFARNARPQSTGKALIGEIANIALPLDGPVHVDPLIEMIGDARFVLLGEATHGTSEFYTWRTEITRRLVTEKRFSFIAVEGDWPDCYKVNRYVKGDGGETAEDVLHAFERWPTWMWANQEVAQLVRWLRAHNERALDERKVGFYGLDVYSLWESMDSVIRYLERVDPAAVAHARRAYSCFEPYNEDAQEYARATALVPISCQAEAVAALVALRSRADDYREKAAGTDDYFDAEQNALIAKNAELYYRTMVRGGPTSWNVRDHHMTDTLDRLMKHHGPKAKAIVWEHNTHIGDARFTDMARAGMVNVGQLVRQKHEQEGVVLVGFGTYKGSVIAGREWGAPMERMHVPEARGGSCEAAMHQSLGRNGLFLFEAQEEPMVALREPRGHRAIGVVYDPRTESWGNYVPTILPQRYDAFLFVDESRAVDPLHIPAKLDGDVPETFPTGQ
ncbi:MAG TPA: erythromycin esterase family protein [Gemmatimonadaceae bacterium]|nr:erythromycin esterase family protein [Gemmatimonadaceae bacterium]